MKLRKCLMVCALAAVMTVGSVSFASAAGSRTNNMTVAEDRAEEYQLTDKIEESEDYKILQQDAPEVVAIIDAVNEGTMEVADVITELKKAVETVEDEEAKKALEEVIVELEKKTFVTGFADLIDLEAAKKNEEGFFDVIISVPSLTEEMKNVEILHYSTERALWEIVKPEKIDVENKTIEAEFKDLSPIAIICDEIEEAE